MKLNSLRIFSVAATVMVSGPVLAQGSVQHGSAAVDHSTRATGHSVAATAQGVSGAAAVALKVSGAAGEVSAAAGDALWKEANGGSAGSLPVTDETVTVGPNPAVAVNREGGQQ